MTVAPRGLFLNTPRANCSIHKWGAWRTTA